MTIQGGFEILTFDCKDSGYINETDGVDLCRVE